MFATFSTPKKGGGGGGTSAIIHVIDLTESPSDVGPEIVDLTNVESEEEYGREDNIKEGEFAAEKEGKQKRKDQEDDDEEEVDDDAFELFHLAGGEGDRAQEGGGQKKKRKLPHEEKEEGAGAGAARSVRTKNGKEVFNLKAKSICPQCGDRSVVRRYSTSEKTPGRAYEACWATDSQPSLSSSSTSSTAADYGAEKATAGGCGYFRFLRIRD